MLGFRIIQGNFMKFRPCIDLHQGIVKQIVGSSFRDQGSKRLQTNYHSQKSAVWFAEKYKNDNLQGGHIIQIGTGNEIAAKLALSAWPGGMQVGGGINLDNAMQWIDAGASHVIVTSWVFQKEKIIEDRIQKLRKKIGKERLVLDLSCRKKNNKYWIVTDRWQNFTREEVTYQVLDHLSTFCNEFLIHAVDVEGKCAGIEAELVLFLGKWSKIPITYAGGIRSDSDIVQINKLGNGILDFTVGSALDIFGGKQLTYQKLIRNYAS